MSLHASERAAAIAAAGVPVGFEHLHLGANPFIDLCGPFYGRPGTAEEGGGLVMGLRVQQRHCNPGGSCHGGMLGTLADLLLVLGANVLTDSRRYMLTVNLDCDFMAPAPLGCWLEGRLQVLRATRNLVFCQGQISADGQSVLGLSGIAKPSGEPDARFTLAHYLGRPV
jgi:uncharacterized protein (TIGR00369 family)